MSWIEAGCLYVCMYVCIYVCMYVCMYVSVHLYTHIYMYINVFNSTMHKLNLVSNLHVDMPPISLSLAQDHLTALMEVNEENQTLTKQFQREKQRRKELEDVSVGGNVCNTKGLISYSWRAWCGVGGNEVGTAAEAYRNCSNSTCT